MRRTKSWIAVALCSAGLCLVPTEAHADNLTVSVREFPSWPEVLVAVRKEPLESGATVHATVMNGSQPVPCDRYVLRLGFRAMTTFHVGGCADGITEIVLTRPDNLPAGVDANAPELALSAEPVIPGVTVASTQGSASLGPVTSGSGVPINSGGSSTHTGGGEVMRAGGLIVAVSFLIAPAFLYGFLEGGLSVEDTLIWTTIICGGGMVVGGIVAVVGASMPSRYGTGPRVGPSFAGATVMPTADRSGAMGAVMFRF